VTEKKDQEPTGAAETSISLSQAVLAPISAILKAQLHAGRSFLNMLLQLGYPHRQARAGGEPGEAGDAEPLLPRDPNEQRPYTLDFVHETIVNDTPKRQKVSIPALALVPVAPLAVESASFSFDMAIKEVGRHSQLKQSEKDEAFEPRPWFLVHEPVSIRGVIAPPAVNTNDKQQSERETTIHVDVKIGAMRMPSGMDRLLTLLTQLTQVEDLPPEPPAQAGRPASPSPQNQQ
jgi:hypothetical protein